MPLEYSRVTLPPLFTLAEAKDHLHITDSAHDADVQQKLDAAQEEIIAVCTTAIEPTWTATTTPKGIKNSILLLLTLYYEQDMAKNQEVREAIRENLAMYRDPTLK
jgi:hypothetical protein